MKFKQVHFIINPAAGQPQPILSIINKAFYEQDAVWEVHITQKDGDGQRMAQQAIKNGADLIVAYGGDGTVKDVVNGMIEGTVPLALLHGGTGNAMAHNLKIPKELEKALGLIIDQDAHDLNPVDLGEITCGDGGEKGYFILRSSIGAQNQLLETASRELKDRFGVMAYVFAAFQTLNETQTIDYHLTVDGQSATQPGFTCIIANAATIGGRNPFDFAPEVYPGDGLLNIFVFDSRYESLIESVQSNLSTDLSQFPGHWAGKEIKIDAETPQEVSIDGELLGKTPVTVKVIPGAVKILTPKNSS